MENKNFHRTIRVNATPEEAFRKIAEVGEWWAKKFVGKALYEGDIFRIEFGTTWVNFKIKQAIPNKKTIWVVTDSYLPWLAEKDEWTNTEIVYELSEEDGLTRIDFTHVGLIPGIECYERCEAGWTRFATVSLPKFMNEGKGLPE